MDPVMARLIDLRPDFDPHAWNNAASTDGSVRRAPVSDRRAATFSRGHSADTPAYPGSFWRSCSQRRQVITPTSIVSCIASTCFGDMVAVDSGDLQRAAGDANRHHPADGSEDRRAVRRLLVPARREDREVRLRHDARHLARPNGLVLT